MSELNEINYRVLIDRMIQDFRPVRRLATISVQLLLWSLLGTAILGLSALLSGQADAGAMLLLHNYGFDSAGFMLLSVAAAWMALRNSIPGREISAGELMMLAVGIIAAALLVQVEPLTHSLLSSDDFRSTLVHYLSFAALPWLTLFWAARRAIPLRPRLTGGIIGVAASCFAIAADLFSGPTRHLLPEQLLAGAFLTGLSVVAGGCVA